MCRFRGSSPGHPHDMREYSPLYYNDVLVLGPRGYVAIQFPLANVRVAGVLGASVEALQM